MKSQRTETCGQHAVPGVDEDTKEQLRVILYCMDKVKALIEEEEENEAYRVQLANLERLLFLWLKNKTKVEM